MSIPPEEDDNKKPALGLFQAGPKKELDKERESLKASLMSRQTDSLQKPK